MVKYAFCIKEDIVRLDTVLVDEGYFESRNKAQSAIKDRNVFVNGVIIQKPSFSVGENDKIEVLEKIRYISRAGDKLKEFLKDKDINLKDKICLDIGSSTGGFVEVLLEFEAKEVTAVDVGKDQLHDKLKNDPKVHSFEECDIRNFQSDTKFDVITCDVSFVSINVILEDILRLAHDKIILLFKPQFEVGKDIKRDRRGVVKDQKAIERVLRDFESELIKKDCQVLVKEESKIKGKEGNVEYFFYIQK